VYFITRYRQRNANLRTQFERIIEGAGVTPWSRLFHNLRSSRQTELSDLHPAHKVCRWLGNTEQVERLCAVVGQHDLVPALSQEVPDRRAVHLVVVDH
jgi:hypothetical protein